MHAQQADGQHRSWGIGQQVGAIALRAAGGLVLAATGGFLTMDTGTGAAAPLVDVDHGEPDVRMNDGACDRAGRFYVGSMAADESPGAGALYRLDPDHRLARLISGIGISNGIGWSAGRPADVLRGLAGPPPRRARLRRRHGRDLRHAGRWPRSAAATWCLMA